MFAVSSRLPPSTTSTSCPSWRNGCSGRSVAAMRAASSRAGTMIERRMVARSGQRAAAARALARRTAVAMVGDGDTRTGQVVLEQVAQVPPRLAGYRERNAEHLVEV